MRVFIYLLCYLCCCYLFLRFQNTIGLGGFLNVICTWITQFTGCGTEHAQDKNVEEGVGGLRKGLWILFVGSQGSVGEGAGWTITISYKQQTQIMTDTWVDTYTMNIYNRVVIILLLLPPASGLTTPT